MLGIALAGCARKPGVPLEMLTWDRDFPPHRVAGNVYFVGRKNVGIFLITTPAGHILLDSGFEASVPAVQASVEQLGFRFQDIKYLLASHAHVDHVQGHARVRQLTGARVLASEQDAPYIRSGGQGRHRVRATGIAGTPCPVDQIVRDGDSVALGGTSPDRPSDARAHARRHHLDHEGDEAARRLEVVFFPSGNVLPGTRLVGNTSTRTSPRTSIAASPPGRPCPATSFWGPTACSMTWTQVQAGPAGASRRRGQAPNPFIDPEGFRKTVAEMEKTFRGRLESQQ